MNCNNNNNNNNNATEMRKKTRFPPPAHSPKRLPFWRDIGTEEHHAIQEIYLAHLREMRCGDLAMLDQDVMRIDVFQSSLSSLKDKERRGAFVYSSALMSLGSRTDTVGLG